MTDYIGLHDEYALVPPQTFADRLTDQWTTAYRNVPSVPLRQLWTTMANTYQAAILDTAAGVTPRWRILWPPTGSGKTLGAKVYAALQAEQSLRGRTSSTSSWRIVRTSFPRLQECATTVT
jgi:hypothetical protein